MWLVRSTKSTSDQWGWSHPTPPRTKVQVLPLPLYVDLESLHVPAEVFSKPLLRNPAQAHHERCCNSKGKLMKLLSPNWLRTHINRSTATAVLRRTISHKNFSLSDWKDTSCSVSSLVFSKTSRSLLRRNRDTEFLFSTSSFTHWNTVSTLFHMTRKHCIFGQVNIQTEHNNQKEETWKSICIITYMNSSCSSITNTETLCTHQCCPLWFSKDNKVASNPWNASWTAKAIYSSRLISFQSSVCDPILCPAASSTAICTWIWQHHETQIVVNLPKMLTQITKHTKWHLSRKY
jgi:hypothetical protein